MPIVAASANIFAAAMAFAAAAAMRLAIVLSTARPPVASQAVARGRRR